MLILVQYYSIFIQVNMCQFLWMHHKMANWELGVCESYGCGHPQSYCARWATPVAAVHPQWAHMLMAHSNIHLSIPVILLTLNLWSRLTVVEQQQQQLCRSLDRAATVAILGMTTAEPQELHYSDGTISGLHSLFHHAVAKLPRFFCGQKHHSEACRDDYAW